MSFAINRLIAERKAWKAEHPEGFIAIPVKKKNGQLNMMKWKCGIPGKGDLWEGGVYPLTIQFSEEYPAKPPKCQFPSGFYHPNIYPSGTVCLSILDEEKDWRPSVTVKQLLLGIQTLLAEPNVVDPAQRCAFEHLQQQPHIYRQRVKAQREHYLHTKIDQSDFKDQKPVAEDE